MPGGAPVRAETRDRAPTAVATHRTGHYTTVNARSGNRVSGPVHGDPGAACGSIPYGSIRARGDRTVRHGALLHGVRYRASARYLVTPLYYVLGESGRYLRSYSTERNVRIGDADRIRRDAAPPAVLARGSGSAQHPGQLSTMKTRSHGLS